MVPPPPSRWPAGAGAVTLALAAASIVAASIVAASAAGAADHAQAAQPLGYSTPLPGLTATGRERFERGRQLFQQRWVVAPSAFGRWGRGPLSNGEACSDCHDRNGRGRPPAHSDEPVRAGLVRLGLPAPNAGQPHPRYGRQLQYQGVLGRVPAEGEAHVDWAERAVRFADGSVITLRRPVVRFAGLAFGPIAADVATSLRIAPPLIGLGLLDAVPAAALEDRARQQGGRRLAGRVHATQDGPGRFGYKAAQPTLPRQVAAALHADLGVTSALFPMQNCTPAQRECLAAPAPAMPEADTIDLEALAEYLRWASPPGRRGAGNAEVARGERAFAQLGCDACHAASMAVHQQAQQPNDTIHPYSDLLLHDLGAGLDDGLREDEAAPQDWRTAPLWGLGLSAAVNGNAWLLHDGRARGVAEAILWHGGEAQAARDAYLMAPADVRRALAAFLASL